MDKPADVRGALMSHPQVRRAEVADLPDLSARPVAVVVADGFATGPELHQHMRAVLDPAGVPEVIAILPDIPWAEGGTADLSALRARLGSVPAVYRFVPARSETERWLAALWANLLGSHDPGIQDDFLEAGGDSVSAISTLTEVYAAYGVEIPLEDFFESATIERLSTIIESARTPA